MNRRAFTLIELLIVVAIIAILAAIAVPNMLEAQIRAKVSRVKSDTRILASALETYAVDYNKYPYCNNNILSGRRPGPSGNFSANELAHPILERLSTPVAYVTNGHMADPFQPLFRNQDHSLGNPEGTAVQISETGVGTSSGYNPHWLIKYGALDPAPNQATGFADEFDEDPKAWILFSSGPDRIYPAMQALMQPDTGIEVTMAQIYDPTNGSVSHGDLWRMSSGGLRKDSEAWGGNLFTAIGSRL